MIIHKPGSKRLPHEGLEYFHMSKEPETVVECVNLFCWHCVYSGEYAYFQKCLHYQELVKKELA